MAAIITLSLKKEDIDNLPKGAIYEGKNTYYNLSVVVNDENDNYGQNVAVTAGQSKEERDAKAPKKYVGNGKVVWVKGNIQTAKSLEDSSDDVF
jgi:hypothetical protein